MSDKASRWRAGRPGRGREPRTRPVTTDQRTGGPVLLDKASLIVALGEGYYPEDAVDPKDDPQVEDAIERRVHLDELTRAAKRHHDDDGWDDDQ